MSPFSHKSNAARDELGLMLSRQIRLTHSGGPSSGPRKDAMNTPAKPQDHKAAYTGADAVVACLKHQGVEVIFGMTGGSIMPVYDAMFRDGGIKHVIVGHEQGAAHMAEGYARATGKVGVVMTTSGPGATNLVTGLADAFMDSTPMVAITGQVTSNLLGQRRLSRGGHARHHHAHHQAQLPDRQRPGAARGVCRGLFRGPVRPPRPGAHRPAQGRDDRPLREPAGRAQRAHRLQAPLPGPPPADRAGAEGAGPGQAPGDPGRRRGDHRRGPQ